MDDYDDDFFDFLSEGNYWDDDGNRLDPDSIPMPNLCISCKHKDDKRQLILCNLNRLDQREEDSFKCYSYECFFHKN